MLLIVAALPGDALDRLHAEARALGLTVLTEVHDEEEVDARRRARRRAGRRQRPQPEDPRGRPGHVRPAGAGRFPTGVVTVAESGIRGPDDVERRAAEGADVVLVGEALVRDGDPARAVREMTGVRL